MKPATLVTIIAALALTACAGQDQFSSGPPPPPLAFQPAPAPVAPQSYIYPMKGQSPQKQEFDRGQCYSWAVQQSGFDPARPPVAMVPPPPPPPSQSPEGGLFRGAMGGAALGAVGGAIGGSAGEGAAIGAAVGGLFSMMRRAQYHDEQQQQYQQQVQRFDAQQQASIAAGRANYNRAFDVCMTGRGYSVQ